MTQYAKIKEDGTLEYAPRNIPGISNWIEDTPAVLAAGYLPLAEIELPEGKYVSGYAVEGGRIMPVLADNPEPTYSELRRLAYPPLEEQLDMIYWDNINGTQNWQNTIAEVKAMYPKPVETDNQEGAGNA